MLSGFELYPRWVPLKRSRLCISFSLRTLTERDKQTQAIRDGWIHRSLRRTFFRPERPTLTSRSRQSITPPFQKHFREVFGNQSELIFYLSLKAWEEKSSLKSHLGWFFLVFGEGKATKENISIFWFI